MRLNSEQKHVLLLWIVLSTSLGAIGQLLFKLGLLSTDLGKSALIIGGLIAYGLSTVVYFIVLGRAHLSWAYGLNGLSYIFTVLLALAFLHDDVTWIRWIGVAAIALGALLIGSTRHK